MSEVKGELRVHTHVPGGFLTLMTIEFGGYTFRRRELKNATHSTDKTFTYEPNGFVKMYDEEGNLMFIAPVNSVVIIAATNQNTCQILEVGSKYEGEVIDSFNVGHNNGVQIMTISEDADKEGCKYESLPMFTTVEGDQIYKGDTWYTVHLEDSDKMKVTDTKDFGKVVKARRGLIVATNDPEMYDSEYPTDNILRFSTLEHAKAKVIDMEIGDRGIKNGTMSQEILDYIISKSEFQIYSRIFD